MSSERLIEAPAQPTNGAARPSHFKARCLRRGFPELHIDKLGASLTPSCKSHAEAFRKCQMLFGKKGAILMIAGNRGCGKTQMAVDLVAPFLEVSAQVEESRWPLYTKISDIFRDIRACFGATANASELAIIAKYTKPHILVIDEAHIRPQSEFEDITLTHIIDTRYDAIRTTIIITNLTRAKAGEALGSSIVSRLGECGDCIECDWPSFWEKRP